MKITVDKMNSIKSHKDWNASFSVRCAAISGVRSEIILHNIVEFWLQTGK